MMVSGLLSLSYIIFSLYFILTSNRMYLGQKYLYPKAIKKVLRVIIIIDIALQILYQNPFTSNETGEKTVLYTILNIIGFNQIINYEKSTKDDIVINTEQLILVFCKAITYFFIGIQILIYSSQKFQEYYLIYIITRKKNLKRKALMNAFRFNNKRIETMNQSIQLREDMPLNMEKLKKKLILDKFLIKFDKWLYQFAVDYSKINPEERDLYEKDVIQGKTRFNTFIEKIVDTNLDNIEFDCFNEAEMIELKKFFVNTKEQLKILEEQKTNKKKEQEKEENKNDKSNKEKDKKTEIDLTQSKFQDIENLIKSDLFQRYLKTSYILKSIFINLLTYLTKKFQFLCYFMMILAHIQNASLISMVYPLSIFCYAIFEYPRPSKNYFRFCFIYSVVILAIKYILQLELWVEIFGYDNSVDSDEKISRYKEAIKNLEHYKTGFKYVKATNSSAFFNYIIYDSLIIIFLLINNLLLIINGLWEQREQEIERRFIKR